jgi:hypothetical protein
MIIAWIEAFFMPSRVRQYNASQATYIAGQILGGQASYYASTAPSMPCAACGGAITPGATFCPHCGITLAART